MSRLRLLITGFGPFPGAPYNPTQPLVARLTRLRRPALADVELSSHIFPVTYRAVDQELPKLLATLRPKVEMAQMNLTVSTNRRRYYVEYSVSAVT